MTKRKRPYLLAACLIPLFSEALADESSALSEDGFFTELPVILTASRMPQQQANLPASVTVIDREMIEAAGVNDMPSLFRLAAGFQIGHDRNQRTPVTSHGASVQFARRMQVLVDGRSIYTPITGGVDWVDLPVSLEDIERIEITRGPNGVTYGANAFLGAINIISRHSADAPGFYLKSILGERADRKNTLRYADSIGQMDYRITVERREDPGFHTFWQQDGGRSPAQDRQRTDALNLRTDYRATTNDYLSFQLGHSQGPRQRGSASLITDPLREQRSRGDYQQIQWRHMRSSDEEFKLQLYRHSQRHEDNRTISLPPRLGYDQSIKTRRHDLEFEHRYAPGERLRLAWGAEARLDYSQAPGYLKQSKRYKTHLYRFFANAEWQPKERWMINAGALLEHNELKSENLSPRLSVNYRLDERHYLRSSYSEAYRTPAVFEEHANARVVLLEDAPPLPAGITYDQLYYSDGNLRSERMKSYELGFGRMDKRLGYEFKLYQEKISDAIAAYVDYASTPPDIARNGSYKFANSGHTTLRGLELQARAQPTPSSLISLAYAYADASGRAPLTAAPDSDKNMALMTPKHTLSVLLSSRFFTHWQASLGIYRVSQFEWSDRAQKARYTAIDTSLRRYFSGSGYRGSVFASLRNLGSRYYDYRDDAYLERRFYAGFELGIR